MDIKIDHAYSKETIMCHFDRTEYLDWHKKGITYTVRCELSKTIQKTLVGEKVVYFLKSNYSLDGVNYTEEDCDEVCYHNMIDTPTGQLVLEQLKDKFMI